MYILVRTAIRRKLKYSSLGVDDLKILAHATSKCTFTDGKVQDDHVTWEPHEGER